MRSNIIKYSGGRNDGRIPNKKVLPRAALNGLSLAAASLLIIWPGCLAKSEELVLASNGSCDYQVIIPVQHSEKLLESAQLIGEAFAVNGFQVPVLTEDKKNREQPGIYLGDTQYARSGGIEPSQFEGWSYLLRVTGEDLVIAGSNTAVRLGVVKGVCDFLREYAGVRFLYPGENGTEFLDRPVIGIPADLDLAVKPMLEFNYSSDMYPEEWFYNIANNHFPAGFKLGGHMWEAAIPYERYFHTHPEYFALVNGKRYHREGYEQYCISNPMVMELIVGYMTELAEKGREVIVLGQPDSFTPCQCEDCKGLYGTGDDWDEKVWLFHQEITTRFRKKYPDPKVIMLAYQATTHPPRTIEKLPENTMVLLSHAYREALEEWSVSGVEVPGGFVLGKRMFGSHYYVNYLPKRTPAWVETVVKDFHDADINISGLRLFGGADCYGLEGPTYYVFGRMLDNPPKNNARDLTDEFYTAAFGQAVDPMRKFYGILHEYIRFCSDWYFPRSASQFFVGLDRKPTGVDDQLDWVRVSSARFGSRGMHRSIEDQLSGLSLIYPSIMVLDMEQELEKAEAMAKGEKVKKRLELVRMEFNYLKNVSAIINLYSAWKIHPEPVTTKRLLDGIDTWNALLDSYYDETGGMTSVPGWPEIRPFRNTGRPSLGLIRSRRWRDIEQQDNPFAWDTKEMRNALLNDNKQE